MHAQRAARCLDRTQQALVRRQGVTLSSLRDRGAFPGGGRLIDENRYCSSLLGHGLCCLCGAISGSFAHLRLGPLPGNGSPLSVTGSDGTIFTFSYAVPGDSQFESFSSGGESFPVGTSFLTPGLGRRAPVAISFSTPLHAVTIPVASGNGSNYVSTVSYYNGTTLLSSSSLAGNLANGAPRFRTDQLVTSAPISLTSDSAFGCTSNIGPIGYSVSAVPLPPSLPMFGAAILGLGAFGYRMG